MIEGWWGTVEGYVRVSGVRFVHRRQHELKLIWASLNGEEPIPRQARLKRTFLLEFTRVLTSMALLGHHWEIK